MRPPARRPGPRPSTRLPELSDDLWRQIALAIEHDPLRCTTIYTTKVMWQAMPKEQLAELKLQRQHAAEFAALCSMSCAGLRGTSWLDLGAGWSRPLTLAHWRTLGTLARCGSLPRLQSLCIAGGHGFAEGVALLADGLRRGRLRSLKRLSLAEA